MTLQERDAALQVGAPRVPPMSGAMPVDAQDGNGLVWNRLRDLWLTNAVLHQHDAARSAAYGWEASEYVPVFQVDSEGELRMLFARNV